MPTPIDQRTGLGVESGVDSRALAAAEVRERLNRDGARLNADAVLS
jgi:hypothetical protein